MRRIVMIAVFLVLVAVPARALSFPTPMDDYVSDYAEVLSGGDAESIRALFDRIETQTGIEITLVTIQSLSQYGASDLRTYAAALFDQWGVGNKNKR